MTTNHRPTLRPAISGKRLLLRQHVASDVDALYAAVISSREVLSRWLAWCHPSYSRNDSAQFIASLDESRQRADGFGYGIFAADTGELLGGIGVNQFDFPHLRANLGYWVRSERSRTGIATAAVQMLAPVAIADLQLERLEIIVAVGNSASQGVAEKVGATNEGIARMRLRVEGRQIDASCYSLIRSDFGLPPVEDLAERRPQ
jgi:ribosomal-protein-serine acetyltransferase